MTDRGFRLTPNRLEALRSFQLHGSRPWLLCAEVSNHHARRALLALCDAGLAARHKVLPLYYLTDLGRRALAEGRMPDQV